MNFKMTKQFIGVPALAFLVATGCDTSVTNPGPVQDEFLDSLSAHSAIVTGAGHDLSQAVDRLAYWGGALTYETNPAGSTGSFGIPTYIQDGRIDRDISGDWNRVQLARWAAENAVARFDSVLPLIMGAPAFGSYEPAGQASLLAGYANRMFGENFCEVVGEPVAQATEPRQCPVRGAMRGASVCIISTLT